MIGFLLATGVIFSGLLGAIAYYLWRRAQSSKRDWEQLMGRLILVDQKGIDRVALDTIEPSGRRRTDELARELTADQIWQMLGGLDGVEILEKNSHVLVEMAMHLQRWYPEAAVAAEDLRLQAKELQWHVERLRMAADKGHLEFHFASYAQNATVDYYLMTQRLVAFAETKPLPPYAKVGRILNP